MLTFAQQIGSRITGTARQLASDQAGQSFQSIADIYSLRESYFDNSMYEFWNANTQIIKQASGLYRNIRPIVNPIRRAVNFYDGRLYPGAMTPDGLPLPDGTPCCIPFASDTDELVRMAMMQAMMWGNWGSQRSAFSTQFPVLGDAFAEIEVDYERGVVYPKFYHPKIVKELEFNGSGDVIRYRIEIPMLDEKTKQSYRWGKIVDRDTITTLYNDEPHGFDDQPATIDNPWGFVPAAWEQFNDVGGQHGASIVDGVREKIDQTNTSLAAVHDYIGKFVSQGIFIAADGGLKAFQTANAIKTIGDATAERTNPQSARDALPYMFVPKDTTFGKPLDNLGLADAVPHIQMLIDEIQKDLPEATLDQKTEGLSQAPSGTALSMMFGGVQSRLNRASANSDHMLTKLMQMSVSIGGQLATSGAWGKQSQLTDQQRKFLPFGIDSFKRGMLDISILPRVLFPQTTLERIQTAAAMEMLKTPSAMEMAGMGSDEITAMIAEQGQAARTAGDLFGRVLNSGG